MAGFHLLSYERHPSRGILLLAGRALATGGVMVLSADFTVRTEMEWTWNHVHVTQLLCRSN